MVGLNTKNVSYVAEAIHDAVTKIKWFSWTNSIL